MSTLSSILGSSFQGEKGPTGNAATITIGTVTSGGNASVTNSGTPGAAILDFNLPIGTFTWPTAGIAVSTGNSWNTSITVPNGNLVGTTATQNLTNKTIISANLSNCTVDGTFSVGYRNVPWSGGADKNTSYTLAVGDIGEFVSLTTSGSITVPAATFTSGDIISLYNNTTGSITITCSAVSTYVGGTNTLRTSVSLATRGICTVFFYNASTCIITGNVS